jgi:hypothetical protein
VWEDHREWVAAVVKRLARTNRGDGLLSMTEAVWSSLSDPLTPAGFEAALRAMRTRYSYPPALRAILRYINLQIAPYMRGADRHELQHGVHGNGSLRRHWSESRRQRAGEALCFDDGSINLVCWVDWRWGGAGKVSERWGCIVGRFQFLLCEDVGSAFFPGYAFVARPLGSYRAEDALGTIARMARYQVRADRHVLEQATWASRAVKDFHSAVGIEAVHTYTPKHKTVEPGFARLWGRMAPDERVSLGRFRDDDEAGNALWRKLRSGTVDPRQHCQSLTEVIALLDKALGRANTEPLTSKVYGSWVPAERWARDLSEHPRGRLGDDLWWAWAPVRRDLTVTSAGVDCKCADVLGESWLYSFSWENAPLYEGKRVRVCFDPASDPCRAAIVLLENSPGTFEKAGAVVTQCAEATSAVPAVVRDNAGARLDWDGGAIERTRQIRAAQRAARQWIFRAFAPDGKTVHTAEAETRGPRGEIATSMRASRDGLADLPPTSRRVLTDEEQEAMLACTLKQERRARERGLIPAQAPGL